MFKEISFVLNGRPVAAAVDEKEQLVDMLRNRFGLTSVKKGCEVGECGACAIIMDGQTINSCIYPAVWVDGHEIVTLEGVTKADGTLDPVQQAFIDEAAIQCGFCTPGFILEGVVIAGSGRKYSREEIRELISGHLCRCTGYENILNALEKVCGLNFFGSGEQNR